ncbi:MAG: DMT family protein [Rhizomicrobium sp.]
MTWPMLFPILMLCASNVFMTFAWYGQLRFPNTPLWQLVLAGWGIAFFEYCLAVPANHYGYRVFSAAELKTIQEIVTLLVFAVFSVFYLGEAIRWNHVAAFACLVGAAYFSFLK